LTLSRISSADLVQTKGLGFSFVAAMWARIASSSAATLGNTPRRIRRRVSRANQPSTRLSQEAEVGVKCRW
jgi:hypothetical protein